MKRYCTILLFLVIYAGRHTASASAQTVGTDSIQIASLPSIPLLPDPLIIDEGGKNIAVQTAEQWQQKRAWIREQYQHWISGSVPPAPETFRVKILSETMEDGVKLRNVELSFGPNDSAKMTLELMIPPSDKQLPVFMTQWSHRGWAQIAVRRGYIACVYAGSDSKDDTRNYSDIYPGYDFATLMKRAWGASRAVDYLYTLPQVDTACIAITGHSRNGKQSLMAAAFDTRIKAVVSSSGGTGAESTFRYSDERFNSESLEDITRNFPHWFNQRLRLFVGREQKLPVDQNSLMALVAPRGLMMVSSISEEQGNPWGIGKSYKSAGTAYHFLHADSNIAILLRRGRHQHSARDVESFIDFFDYIFGRSKIAPRNELYYDYSFEKWKQISGESIDPLKFPATGAPLSSRSSKLKVAMVKEDSIRKHINWLLGEEPPGVQGKMPLSPALKKNHSYSDDYLEEVIGEFSLPENVKKMAIGPYHALGDDLWGSIYFPAGSVVNGSVSGKLPLVIYLHEYSYATGYHRSRRSLPLIQHLTDRGFAVLAFDMVGFGTRVEEALHFYERYPHWSLMGKMVADTRSILDDVCNRMPFIDSGNIYLAGYSLGGTVALFTAALDSRVKGTAVASAFSSLGHDNVGTEGIKHYAELHGLIPRLGFFMGHEDRIPVDFEDVLSGISPRSLLVIAPQKDRHHSIESVRETVSIASKKYSDLHLSDRLTFQQPDTYNHFSGNMQMEMASWLKQELHEHAETKK